MTDFWSDLSRRILDELRGIAGRALLGPLTDAELNRAKVLIGELLLAALGRSDLVAGITALMGEPPLKDGLDEIGRQIDRQRERDYLRLADSPEGGGYP